MSNYGVAKAALAKPNSPVCSVRRNLNVESATNDLDGAVADLREAVDALEQHLSPLLASERPESEGDCRSRGDSELAERIMTNADYVRNKTARIRDLIDRL